MATAVGMTGAPGLRCSGGAMTSVRTTLAQLGPKGTTAENSTDLSGGIFIAVTLTFRGTCWAAVPNYFSGRPRRDALRLPRRPKRLAQRRGTDDARCMQKRAKSARARRAILRLIVLPALSLALMATAVGMTGAPGLRCSGGAMTSVRTTLAQLGPKGTTAENS
jgi:hypothetical protein